MTRVLGIDPGYDRIGIAIADGDSHTQKIIYSECYTPLPYDSFIERLSCIGEHIEKIIKEHRPSIMALEDVFFNKNQKTALKVAEARGMMMYIGIKESLSIHSFTPTKIKTTITGYGSSTKKDVETLIKRTILLPHTPSLDDEYDAIGIALTFLFLEKSIHRLSP